LSHGIVWVTSPFLLRRWLRLYNQFLPENQELSLPAIGSCSLGKVKLYLKDAIFQPQQLNSWTEWKKYIPANNQITQIIDKVLVLSDADCQTLIQTSLWRQVRVNLGEGKVLAENAGFRYEEAIPPETLMYFPWGSTTAANGTSETVCNDLRNIFISQRNWQFGGQESLGRGLVELWNN
jgi:CRISPR-associated protein Cmr4